MINQLVLFVVYIVVARQSSLAPLIQNYMIPYGKWLIFLDTKGNIIGGTRRSRCECTRKAFYDCLQDTYLDQHDTQPTRFRERQRSTCDDIILTTDEGDISDITYSPGIGKSDHIRLQFHLYTNIRRHYATREYRLREIMLMINWTQELQEPQGAMDISLQHLNFAVDRWAPIKKVKSSSYAGQKPVWMTQVSLRMVHRKLSAWINYLNTKNVHSYNRYIHARNTASHALRNARRRFESNLAYECRSNNKAVWHYVNSQKKIWREEFTTTKRG